MAAAAEDEVARIVDKLIDLLQAEEEQ